MFGVLTSRGLNNPERVADRTTATTLRSSLAAVTLSLSQLLQADAKEPDTTPAETPEQTIQRIAPKLQGDAYMDRQEASNVLTELLASSRDPQRLFSLIELYSKSDTERPMREYRMRLGKLRDVITEKERQAYSSMSIRAGSAEHIRRTLEEIIDFPVQPADEAVAQRIAQCATIDLGSEGVPTTEGLVKLCRSIGCTPRLTANGIVLDIAEPKTSVSCTERLVVVKRMLEQQMHHEVFHMPDNGALLTFDRRSGGSQAELGWEGEGSVWIELVDGRMPTWRPTVREYCPPITKKRQNTMSLNVVTATSPIKGPVPFNKECVRLGSQELKVIHEPYKGNDGWFTVVLEVASIRTDAVRDHIDLAHAWGQIAANRYIVSGESGATLPTTVERFEREPWGARVKLVVQGKPGDTMHVKTFEKIQSEQLIIQ